MWYHHISSTVWYSVQLLPLFLSNILFQNLCQNVTTSISKLICCLEREASTSWQRLYFTLLWEDLVMKTRPKRREKVPLPKCDHLYFQTYLLFRKGGVKGGTGNISRLFWRIGSIGRSRYFKFQIYLSSATERHCDTPYWLIGRSRIH